LAPGLFFFRPGHALLDPGPQCGDLLVRQALARWHLQIALLLDGLNQQTLRGRSRLRGRSTRASRQNVRPIVESQTAGPVLLVVTREAVRTQHHIRRLAWERIHPARQSDRENAEI